MFSRRAVFILIVSASIVHTGAAQVANRSTENVEILEFEEPVDIRSVNGGYVSYVNIFFQHHIRRESDADGWYLEIQSLSDKELHEEVDSVEITIENRRGELHTYELLIDEYNERFSYQSSMGMKAINNEYSIKPGRRMINRISVATFAEIKINNSKFRLNDDVFYRAKVMLSRVSP